MQRSLGRRVIGATRRLLTNDVLRMATLLALAAFALDSASKSWALQNLEDMTVPVGGLVFGVERNEGFAFSAGAGLIPTWLVAGARLAVLLLIILAARGVAASSRRYACGVALLLAGGFGNTVDLLFRDGAVVDFIGAGPLVLGWADRIVHTYFVFNAGDLAILIGLVLVAPMIREMGRTLQGRLAAALPFGRTA
jgi:lipoprotein signal peptidase